jgi:hypothetical protein
MSTEGRARGTYLLALAAAIGAASVGFLATSDEGGSPQGAEPLGQVEAQEAPRVREPVELLRPDDTGEVPLGDGKTRPPEAGKEASSGASELPAPTFEEKYAGKTHSELREIRTQLVTTLQKATGAAGTELLDLGYGEEVPEGSTIGAFEDEPLRVHQVRDGKNYRVTLEPHAYPALYALRDEILWVDERRAELLVDHLRKNPPGGD